MKHRLLLVDDEPEILDINKRYLIQAGYDVTTAHNGKVALAMVKDSQFDLIITDIMMPEMDGYDFISEVTYSNPEQAFLFITAKISEPDKIYALSLGADDFITKPFSPRELVLRTKNILRRLYKNVSVETAISIGDLVIDHSTYQASIDGHFLELTNKAFEILWILGKNQNRVFSKMELYEKVWEETYLEGANTLNVHIHTLRQELSRFRTDKTPTIKTVWGLGYKLEI